MNLAKIEAMAYAGAIVAAIALGVYVLARPRQAGRAAGSAVVGAATNLAAGVVEGSGEAIGIPLTDETKCRACIAARQWFQASLYCPAGTFLKAITGTSSASASSAPSSADTAPPGAPATSAQPGAGAGPAVTLPDSGDDLNYYGTVGA